MITPNLHFYFPNNYQDKDSREFIFCKNILDTPLYATRHHSAKKKFYLVDISENGQKRPKTHLFEAGVQPLNVFQKCSKLVCELVLYNHTF